MLETCHSCGTVFDFDKNILSKILSGLDVVFVMKNGVFPQLFIKNLTKVQPKIKKSSCQLK